MTSVAYLPICRDMSELATEYMEGALAWRPHASVWLHLRRCSACRRYYGQMRATSRLLAGRALPGLEPERERSILDRMTAPITGTQPGAGPFRPDGPPPDRAGPGGQAPDG